MTSFLWIIGLRWNWVGYAAWLSLQFFGNWTSLKVLIVKYNMSAALAKSQFERDLIVERTKEGLASARARGRKGGRKPVNAKNLDKALKMYATKQFSISRSFDQNQ